MLNFLIISFRMSKDVGRGHVPADREAADSTDEQVCTQPVVPAPVRRVVAPYGIPVHGFFGGRLIAAATPILHGRLRIVKLSVQNAQKRAVRFVKISKEKFIAIRKKIRYNSIVIED